MCSGYVESLYYDYIFYPRVKAQDHYIMPLRWQDITAESLIACALVALLLLSAYLLRSAFRRQEKNENLVSSFHEKAGECQVFSFIVSKLFKNVPFITSFKMSPFCILVRPLFLSLCPIPVLLEEFRARVS